MDIKQLINFITIVEEGNITKAAQKLHLSQPPLSNQLKSLEQELGVKLVERGSRKITLTDVGNLLYKRGKDMISMFESTLNEVEDFSIDIDIDDTVKREENIIQKEENKKQEVKKETEETEEREEISDIQESEEFDANEVLDIESMLFEKADIKLDKDTH